ncbi:hypothetical protein [uncultured Tateyamaria sp.]|uniref:hypothetical protein n=1 Tax=uncultured Tateyamaria sp. TaxID=455651 RepID=UPI0026126C88|nr:hypothetical protein [uncultured Tateyamaria sp.]
MPASLDVLRGAKEIADFLNTTPARIYRLHRERRIRTFMEGATICARKATLMADIERQEATK